MYDDSTQLRYTFGAPWVRATPFNGPKWAGTSPLLCMMKETDEFPRHCLYKNQEMNNIWNNSPLYLHKGEYTILHYIYNYILIILVTLYKENLLCSWKNYINSMERVNGSLTYIILCPYHLGSNCWTPRAFEALWSLFILVKHWCHLVILVSRMSSPTDKLHSPELFWKK
jgi:hypothetical protein